MTKEDVTSTTQALLARVEELISARLNSSPDGFYVSSSKMQAILRHVAGYIRSDCPLLIVGETGTGKEKVARLIADSLDVEMVEIDCSVFTPQLIASELFGHEKGAFTGAEEKRVGLIRTAEGKILFLDELSMMPESLQAQLLRVLQNGKFRPVGSNKVEEIDKDNPVRVIAATNSPENLKDDLRWRFPYVINVPSLRGQVSEVFFLLELFLSGWKCEWAEELEGTYWSFTPASLMSILTSEWKGNVRELWNEAIVSLNRWRTFEVADGKDARSSNSKAIPFVYSNGAPKVELARRIVKFAEAAYLISPEFDVAKRLASQIDRYAQLLVGSREEFVIYEFAEAYGIESSVLTIREALGLIARISYGFFGERVRINNVEAALDLFNENREKILNRLCPEKDPPALKDIMLHEPKSDGQSSELDLTRFSEQELLTAYYSQLENNPTLPKQKDRAKRAGLSESAYGAKIKKLGVKRSKMRKSAQ